MDAGFSARRWQRVRRAMVMCMGALAVFAMPAAAQAATVNVATGGADSGTCGIGANPACATVAQAVANAAAGDTVEVGAGTFTGSGQLMIAKNLTLSGAGAEQTTLEPGFDTSPATTGSWIQVSSGNTFDLNQIALDGSGSDVGQAIRYVGSAGGAIDEVDFRNISGGHPYFGIAVATNKGGPPDAASGDLDITESTFEDIQRVGVLYKGADVTGTFEDNTYTG
jgi:hypothetical protein